jgi:diguanylate cyclase (GGDEF)-like protein
MHDDPPVDICIIEDDDAQRALLVRRLSAERLNIVECRTGEEGLTAIRRHHPRVIVCDLNLPDLSGADLCRQVRAEAPLEGSYLVVVTACSDRRTRYALLNAGADDYLTKPYDYVELLARVRNGLRISHLHERLRRAALSDGLTGLWNHAQFRELLDTEFARTRRYGGEVALLMLDLDHFKSINDTYGHEIGNRVLQATAGHLQRTVRESDIVARYGGEEFAIICPQTGLDDAERLAERIRTSLAEQVRLSQHPDLRITATIGVSSSEEPGVNTALDLINQADQALYAGKAQGRNCVMRAGRVLPIPPGESTYANEIERLRKQILTLSMQAKQLCLRSVWALVQALEARDPFTAWQSRNTRFYVGRLARAAGWSENLRETVTNAAMLHNLGKIGVPDRILQKPEPLSAEEAAVIRQVPLITCKILEPLRVFDTEIHIIRHLRERYDGTGYPSGLSGNSIPIGSRLLAVAEAFAAMTTNRTYRCRRSLDAALEEIAAQAGRQFDPQFAELINRVARQERKLWQKRIDSTLAVQPDRQLTLPSTVDEN